MNPADLLTGQLVGFDGAHRRLHDALARALARSGAIFPTAAIVKRRAGAPRHEPAL